jgi:hypothetical protein
VDKILHGVPRSMDLEEIRADVENWYIVIKFGQTPRWFAVEGARKGKSACTAVLVMLGSVPLSCLDREVYGLVTKIAQSQHTTHRLPN